MGLIKIKVSSNLLLSPFESFLLGFFRESQVFIALIVRQITVRHKETVCREQKLTGINPQITEGSLVRLVMTSVTTVSFHFYWRNSQKFYPPSTQTYLTILVIVLFLGFLLFFLIVFFLRGDILPLFLLKIPQILVSFSLQVYISSNHWSDKVEIMIKIRNISVQ